MASIPKPVLILTVFYQGQGQQMSNVSFWALDTPPTTQSAMDTLVGAASEGLAAVYLPLFTPAVSWLGATGKYLSGSSILESTATTGSGTGENDNIVLPDQTAAVIDKQTAQYGRQYVGRYFIGGLSSGILDPLNSNEIGGTAQDKGNLNTLAEYYGADKTWGASTAHARHWDRKSGTLVPVTKCVVRTRIAVQKRRRRRQLDSFVPQ